MKPIQKYWVHTILGTTRRKEKPVILLAIQEEKKRLIIQSHQALTKESLKSNHNLWKYYKTNARCTYCLIIYAKWSKKLRKNVLQQKTKRCQWTWNRTLVTLRYQTWSCAISVQWWPKQNILDAHEAPWVNAEKSQIWAVNK